MNIPDHVFAEAYEKFGAPRRIAWGTVDSDPWTDDEVAQFVSFVVERSIDYEAGRQAVWDAWAEARSAQAFGQGRFDERVARVVVNAALGIEGGDDEREQRLIKSAAEATKVYTITEGQARTLARARRIALNRERLR